MKKLLALLLTLAVTLGLAACALAEAPTEGSVLDGATFENDAYYFGDGANYAPFAVMPDINKGELITCVIKTDKEKLLDAMEEHGLVKYEQVSWGCNITDVLDYKTDYEKDGSYWQIAFLDEQALYKLQDPIQDVGIDDYGLIVFVLTK